MLTLSQHIDQILGILLALFLSSLIGLERQARGKSAGLRTDAIVGMTSALLMVVSKYGFNDVLAADLVRVDPSRVAAQIVSGIGFLGAGIILTRSGAVRGLTTAATVWETAGIGMACGAGLWIAGTAVTLMHFIIVFALTPLSRHIGPHAPRRPNTIVLELVFDPGQGVMRSPQSLIFPASIPLRKRTLTARTKCPRPRRLCHNSRFSGTLRYVCPSTYLYRKVR